MQPVFGCAEVSTPSMVRPMSLLGSFVPRARAEEQHAPRAGLARGLGDSGIEALDGKRAHGRDLLPARSGCRA